MKLPRDSICGGQTAATEIQAWTGLDRLRQRVAVHVGGSPSTLSAPTSVTVYWVRRALLRYWR